MAFEAHWAAISYDGGGIAVSGDTRDYHVRWGDGSAEQFQLDPDTDGNGIFDGASPVHFYASDGTYDVAVSQDQAGLPPERLRAFMYSRAEGDITIGGTHLSDIITAGLGNDTLSGAGGKDTIGGADGSDRINGGAGEDFLLGGNGDDVVIGGTGVDLITGDDGADRLSGGTDTDYIYAGSGKDALFGDDGDDYLQGDAGADRLTGGAGADVFVFAPPRDADGNQIFTDPDRDTVTDFQQGADHLSVDQWSSEGFAFLGTGRFTGDGHPEVRYAFVNGGTVVTGDADGDRIADFSFRIEGQVPLTAEDFRI